jgi:hypothetical protein
VERSAVHVCRSSMAGFVDALIAQVGKAAGCGQTVSFDMATVRFAGMVAVGISMKIESESFDFHGGLASRPYRNPNLSACDLRNVGSGRKRSGM